ncbi:MAG: SsrA-binding protein SmpB [Chloroflexota bacterium]|nr:SsrA-binding protein SmpB [Chloroflexota bacterium]
MARKRRRRQATPAPPSRDRTLAVNRRARYDYVVLDAFDAGLELRGTEIKSLRTGSVSLREGYVAVQDGEAFLRDVHIARYKPAADANHDPDRPRKLLLHRAEIDELARHTNQAGHTAVPLRLYLDKGWAKVEIGLVRGRRAYDKREKIRARDDAREIARRMR